MIQDDGEINLAGVCAIAPFIGVFAAAVLFIAAAALNQGAAPIASTPVAMLKLFSESLPGLFVVPIIGGIIALPGMFVFGYPVLKFFRQRGFHSIILHAMSGALFGGFYLAALSKVVGFTQSWGEIFAAFMAGAVFGLLTGLSARWAMTWRWLRH